MCGFANPISFKKITDSEISLVEQFIRTNTLQFLTQNASDSIDENCDVLVDDDTLNQYFGPMFAQNTSSFRFQVGDVVLIKELVNHVQLKVEKHGHSYFKNTKKKTKEKINAIQKQNVDADTIEEIDEHRLKVELEQKVIEYFKKYVPESNVDTVDVALDMKDEKHIYGLVHCSICKLKNRAKLSPNRVFLNTKNSSRGVWVLGNFKKHLETKHSTNSQPKPTKENSTPRRRKRVRKSKKVTQKCETPMKEAIDISTLACSIEIVEVDEVGSEDVANNEDKENSSLILVSEQNGEREKNMKTDSPDDLFAQLSSQVTKVHEAVLTNTEKQIDMDFVLNNTAQKIKVTPIRGDGNCLFGSLAHQLWLHKIDSDEHKTAMMQLRANVVEHILNPQNFARFEHQLHDRVYSLKEKAKKLKEITNISAECQLFVRHALSNDRTWGGSETLLAVSDLYSTNVVVFIENGNCLKIKQPDQIYNRSIAVAYRSGYNENGELTHNHYDSVCDINSDDVYTVACYIANK